MEEKVGWIDTELNQVAEIIMGQSPPSSTYNENGIGLPFFQGKAEFTELHPVISKWCSKPKKVAEPNDILISVRAPVGATNIANQKCCIGRGLAAIRYHHCNNYVFYFLRLIENELDKKGTGTTFKAISGSVLKSEIIPIPPLPEQRAIVSKIEQLFSELDNGIANLKRAQEQLKVYRQAVLKKAFEGELTKKWRGQQIDLPNAEDLLEQIRIEREEAVIVSSKKRKQVKLLPDLELAELPKLPEGWIWTNINQICFVDVGFAFKSSDFVDNGIRLLRGDNIEPGSLRWENTKYLSKEKIEDYNNLIVKKDEIILAMDRPLISSGLKLAMAKDSDVPCLLVQRMARFQPISVDNKYLYYSLQSKDFIHHLLSGQTGTQLPHVSEKNILNFIFSLPSLAELYISTPL